MEHERERSTCPAVPVYYPVGWLPWHEAIVYSTIVCILEMGGFTFELPNEHEFVEKKAARSALHVRKPSLRLA